MEQLIQSYYAYLRDRLMGGDSTGSETGQWGEFLHFLLEHSIPHQLSASVSFLSLSGTPVSEIALELELSNPILPPQEVRIQGEAAYQADPSSFALHALLECVQWEIRQS
jgi:hypothetical protein